MIFIQLMEINTKLFYIINHNLQNSFFDFLMPMITDIGSMPFVLSICILLLVYSIITKNMSIKYLAITGIIAILFTDIIISILKVLINEPRPFHTLTSVHLLISENDPYSFPSGHSGYIFALAISLGLNWKFSIRKKEIKLLWLLIPLAFIVGFSRVYIGVHYPFDVFIGAIIGTIGGVIATKIMSDYLTKNSNN